MGWQKASLCRAGCGKADQLLVPDEFSASMHESNTWIKLLCAAVKIVIVKPDYNSPPPSKGQWQYTKDLPVSNVNISWNKDHFLHKLCISQGRRLDSASRVQSSQEVKTETHYPLGDWSLVFGNTFFPSAACLPHLTNHFKTTGANP